MGARVRSGSTFCDTYPDVICGLELELISEARESRSTLKLLHTKTRIQLFLFGELQPMKMINSVTRIPFYHSFEGFSSGEVEKYTRM